MTLQDSACLKRIAAREALRFVHDGMRLGLGTGSTAEAFLDALAERVRNGLRIAAAATSERTRARAADLGIPVYSLEELTPLDLTVDGADEADRQLRLIKGGGGALLREKIVAAASAKMAVICDGSKLVRQLGRFPLPVEVTSFGHPVTFQQIGAALQKLGYVNAQIVLRQSGDDGPFHTDGGNVIYDCALGSIVDAPKLAQALKSIPGVVEHGLFIELASWLIIANSPNDVEIIERAGSA